MHTSLRNASFLSFANDDDASIAFSRKNLENRTSSNFFGYQLNNPKFVAN